MIYPTNEQNINFKYFIFWATQKWQKSKFEHYIFYLQNMSDFAAQNKKKFRLRFCMIVKCIRDNLQNYFQIF
jgi:hypothetical protein